MKKHWKLMTSTFFIRLFFSFFCIVFFCGIVLLIVSGISQRDLRRQYLEHLDQSLVSVAQRVDAQFSTIQNLGVNFFLDSNTILYFKPEVAKLLSEKSEQWRIHRLLQQQEALMPVLVHDIYAFIPSDVFVLSSAGHYDMPFFFTEMDRYDDYDADFWNLHFDKDGIKEMLPETVLETRSGSRLVIPVVTTSRIDASVAIHVANVDAAQLKDLFFDNTVTGSTAFAIVDKHGNLLFSTEPALFGDGRYERYMSEPVHSLFDGRVLLRWKSNAQDWTYLALVDNSNIKSVLDDEIPWFVTLILFLVLGGIALAILFSLRIYQPINKVTEMLPASPDIKKGKSDEVQILENGIGRLLSDAGEQKEIYARHALHLMVNGLEPDDKDKLVQILQTQYHFTEERIICVLFFFDYHQAYYASMNKDQQRAFIQKCVVLIEQVCKTVAPSIAMDLHGGMFACIINLSPLDRAKLIEQLVGMEKLFKTDQVFYSLHIGVGNSQVDVTKLSVSYNQGLAALKVLEKNVPFGVMEYSRLPVENKVDFNFYDQKAIATNIATGNASTLSRYLDDLFARNDKRGISPENVKELYHQVYLTGERCLNEHQIALDQVSSYSALKNYLEKGIGEGRELLRAFFLEIQEMVYVPSKDTNESQLVRETQSYLEKNYDKPLSLDMIADDLHVSAKYLSRIYKQQCGENLTLILSLIRIEKAKYLLKDDTLKIADIAGMVGMDSRATFLRVFKKIAGVSPSEYRAMVLQEGNASEEEKKQ